jgi:hypothetical protein
MTDTGFIVIIAYPDTIVRTANGELISKVWPYLGVGGKNRVQAGHAALLLISKETSEVEYFDFGRYITSDTYGRVRSQKTDYEVKIPLEAKHDGVNIINLKEILLYLENNPDKTHGEGRMVVSVNHKIDYFKAKNYILDLQLKNQVPYGAFRKNASNCARFVTDTLIRAANDKRISRKLKRSKYLTPSPISNVINGGVLNSSFLEVFGQKVYSYENRSISREHWNCFFNDVPQEVNEFGTVLPDENKIQPINAQWLGGIGSGAWFELKKVEGYKDDEYRVVRRNVDGFIDVDAVFLIDKTCFDINKKFSFLHGSNGNVCLVEQNNNLYQFSFNRKN